MRVFWSILYFDLLSNYKMDQKTRIETQSTEIQLDSALIGFISISTKSGYNTENNM